MFKKRVKFHPAWDQRDSDPNHNYGIRDVHLRFSLIGDKGAVQLLMATGWYLPELQISCQPVGHHIGIHSYVPTFDDQEISQEKCDLLPCKNGKCFYGAMYCESDRLVNELIKHGDNAVWKKLKEIYFSEFKNISLELINENKVNNHAIKNT